MENTREQKLKYIFGANRDVKEFHVTSDDQAFRSAVDAANHAKTLKDQDVKVEKRSDYVQSKEEDEKSKKDKKAEAAQEREALVKRHVELLGKEPAKTAGVKAILKNIEAEEARRAEAAAETGAEGNADADQSGEEE